MPTSVDCNDPLELLECCCEIFSHPPMSRESIAVYFNAIGAHTQEQLTLTFQFWLRSKTHFPTPADIRQIIEHHL